MASQHRAVDVVNQAAVEREPGDGTEIRLGDTEAHLERVRPAPRPDHVASAHDDTTGTVRIEERSEDLVVLLRSEDRAQVRGHVTRFPRLVVDVVRDCLREPRGVAQDRTAATGTGATAGTTGLENTMASSSETPLILSAR